MKYDVIIVGAGAAGLMAMKILTGKGKKVCLLEAQEKAGGRCNTMIQDGFDAPIETGAEFVHKQAELTRKLLSEAGIAYKEVEGKFISVEKGEWVKGDHRDKLSKKFFKKVKKSDEDRTVRQVMDEHFTGEEDRELREAVTALTEGFSLADTIKASAIAMKKDWETQEETMYRITGGYEKLINWLLDNCHREGSVIQFSSTVFKIKQTIEGVKVYAGNGDQYEAKTALVTVSAGVLQANEIEFIPAMPDKELAIKQLGFGPVIKILFRFKEDFWIDKEKEMGFVISDEFIPVWWTQLPVRNTVLTGWLGGPAAARATALPGDQLYEKAILSLSRVFHCTPDFIRSQLTRHKIICWESNPFIRGGYSYRVVGHEKLYAVMSKPESNKIYFSGEAVYDGDQQGTVEAALVSGKETAEKILKSLEL